MEYENLILEKEDGIGTIKINRPKALNALNEETLKELGRAVEEFNEDTSVKVIIMTGEGEKAFVAGADIAAMVKMSPDEALEFSKLGHDTLRKIESSSKLVIAAVNGFALGGGCELAMACDIRYASSNAKLGQPEVNLGIIPGFAGTQRLPRLVGRGKAKELILSADIIKAVEAYRIGLVDQLFEDQGALMDGVKGLAKKVMEKGPESIKASLEIIDKGLDMTLEEACEMERQKFKELFEKGEPKEGMSAFLEKRKANF